MGLRRKTVDCCDAFAEFVEPCMDRVARFTEPLIASLAVALVLTDAWCFFSKVITQLAAMQGATLHACMHCGCMRSCCTAARYIKPATCMWLLRKPRDYCMAIL